MKRLCLLILLLSTYILGYTQNLFAIIDDPDGYTNVRNGEKQIVGKIYESDVFYIEWDCDIGTTTYVPIRARWELKDHFERFGNKEENGEYPSSEYEYIHKSRVKLLSNLPQLSRTIVNENQYIFENESIIIVFATAPIDRNNTHIVEDDMNNIPIEIDGYQTHGIDWRLREIDTEIQSISYSINGCHRQFAPEHIEGFLNISGETMSVAEGRNNTLYITSMGGDGSGGYETLWIIKNGEVKAAIAFIPF